MPIQSGDIVLLESDTMDDTDQGGGAMTGNIIVDGQSNNIFEDISTLDRTYGAVKMRNVFPSVKTQSTDKYFGSHFIISKIPKDNKISINLFNSEDWFDRRPEAQSRIENYRAQGSVYNGWLWVTQYKDSKVLNVFQSKTAPVPGTGDVMYLRNTSGTNTQYVKIIKVTESLQTFDDGTGSYDRNILILEISQGLKYDFVGHAMTRSDSLSPDASMFNTVVANAAKYFSARPTSLYSNNGDLSVKVDTVYSQVVPSNLQKLAILDANAYGITVPVLNSSTNPVVITHNAAVNEGSSLYLGSPITPNTMLLATNSGYTVFDEGGQIKPDNGGSSIGTVNYGTGEVNFADSQYITTATFEPGCEPQAVANTAMQDVDVNNRGFIWNYTISPPPKPKSLQISFLILGEWYSLYDDGSGKIEGLEEGIGSGTVNYVTGTTSITLTALPDAESAIVYAWGKEATYMNRSDITPNDVEYEFQLSQTGIKSSTATISWTDGIAKTATIDVNGDISGDATGTLDSITGVLKLSPNTLPVGGVQFTVDYDNTTQESDSFNDFALNGSDQLVLILSNTNIVANTVKVELRINIDFNESVTDPTYDYTAIRAGYEDVELHDDGLGDFNELSGSTVDYTNGVVTFLPNEIPIKHKEYLYDTVVTRKCDADNVCSDIATHEFVGYRHNTGSIQNNYEAVGAANAFLKVWYEVTGTGATTVQDTFTSSDISFDLTENFDEQIVIGSVRFKLGSRTYVDRSGSLYYNISRTTGAGTFGGTIDYVTGIVTITSWATGSSNVITVESLTTTLDYTPVRSMKFRIPSAPVKSQSLQLRVNKTDGTEITCTSDGTGNLIGDDFDGFIDYQTGLVSLETGRYVTASGNEGEPWYNITNVVGSNVWKPEEVLADSMLYNATSQTFLPLNEDILKLNPVRLPQDGRIPVYSDGDVIVILHDNTISKTPINGEVYQLNNIRVTDSTGALVDGGKFTINVGTETLTWGDVAGISMPCTITDDQTNSVSATYTTSQVVSLDTLVPAFRGRISKLSIKDTAGNEILASYYSVDLATGIITFNDPTGLSMPLSITDRIEDMGVVSDVQITGKLTITRPLTHNFPAEETLVSNAVIYGDLFAHTTIPFDQTSWNGTWSDVLQGTQPSSQYNNSLYPITVDNASCIQERWYVKFTSPTAFDLIGEHVGQIDSGTTGVDFAPTNPNTAQPYFTILALGWGNGWSTGNILRFNTIGANGSVWIIQSINSGPATDPDFDFRVEFRGDVDTP